RGRDCEAAVVRRREARGKPGNFAVTGRVRLQTYWQSRARAARAAGPSTNRLARPHQTRPRARRSQVLPDAGYFSVWASWSANVRLSLRTCRNAVGLLSPWLTTSLYLSRLLISS